MSETEDVMLVVPKGEPFIVAVQRGALLHRVPNREKVGTVGIEPAIRGATFGRTKRFDPEFGLPLFRREG